MEELFEQLKRAITPAQDSAAKRTATAMDGISDRMADAAAASYIASVAEDAGFEESDHPREAKGGTGGGRFRTSGKTIEREDVIEEDFKEGDFVESRDGKTWRVFSTPTKKSYVVEVWQWPGSGLSVIPKNELKRADPSVAKAYKKAHEEAEAYRKEHGE